MSTGQEPADERFEQDTDGGTDAREAAADTPETVDDAAPAGTPGDRVRASDPEREQIAEILRTAVTEGRLTLAEGDERLARLYTAKYRDELPRLLAELPDAARLYGTAAPESPQDAGGPGWGGFGVGRGGPPWGPGRHERHGHGGRSRGAEPGGAAPAGAGGQAGTQAGSWGPGGAAGPQDGPWGSGWAAGPSDGPWGQGPWAHGPWGPRGPWGPGGSAGPGGPWGGVGAPGPGGPWGPGPWGAGPWGRGPWGAGFDPAAWRRRRRARLIPLAIIVAAVVTISIVTGHFFWPIIPILVIGGFVRMALWHCAAHRWMRGHGPHGSGGGPAGGPA